MCLDNNDVNVAFLQMRSVPIGAVLPSPVTQLFNRPIRTLLPQTNRKPVNFNVDSEYNKALKTFQDKFIGGIDTHEDSFSYPVGSTVAVHCKDSGL